MKKRRKMKMKKNNNLDEMQEQELLKIEHNGCWMAFWMLLISMMIQVIFYGFERYEVIAGEWVVFMILSLYLAIACSRKGIWDRHLKMNFKTNVIISVIAGLAMLVFNAIVFYGKFGKIFGALAAGCVIGLITFVICILMLSFMKKCTEKKQADLDKEPEEN